MDRKLQQRLVGIAVLASFLLLIAPVLLDADGRIPEKITHIPPQPKRPDLSHIRTVDSTEPQLQPLPSLEEVELTIAATEAKQDVAQTSATGLWSVQVASFKDSRKATSLRDQLRDADMKVYVREKLLSDGTLFTQVFVGPVQSMADAQALKNKVKTEFKEQGLVVRFRE